MTRYVLRRLAMAVPVLLGVSMVVFLVMHLIPGDPVEARLGERAGAEAAERMRRSLGLDKPIPVQYGIFLWRAVHGDFGKSIRTGDLAVNEIRARFPATVELTAGSLLLAVTLGILLGVVAAVRQNSWVDATGMVVAVLGVSIPVFWLAIMLIYLFGVHLQWLPISGRLPPGMAIPRITGLLLVDTSMAGNWTGFKHALRHLVLPSIALGSIQMAVIARMTRSSLLEVIRQDYIRTARAKGLAERVVIYRHALKNALIPVVTVIGLTVGGLLGGAVLTETIFAWPGIGKFSIDSIYGRDYPVVQGIVLLVAIGFIAANLLVDVMYAYLDPRIRYE